MDDDEIEERLQAIGRVTIRRMFGGKGIYSEGCIVALVVRGELLLKVDEETAPVFDAAGARRWSYARTGKAPVAMPYFTVPDEALDDPDLMADWARLARAAGHRTAAPKTPNRKRIVSD
ncbi:MULTISPECIES: TfoX/Sxy family protein [unclassified Aureimonas]|uniref:TfoX/Sxy family protein n=1 Tax=unclassified Aureimonas TaxID=2615206 RepID=UPI0006FB075D|nr:MULTISPECIES: TfoX/Sxy family protein [unclassified Aureimonas]KQT60397.1 competence protein TfoX [Aureimonas sp. Leaf427]KQT79275.1 competence protein TfoX [Aureimonas sp. Leaf460]